MRTWTHAGAAFVLSAALISSVRGAEPMTSKKTADWLARERLKANAASKISTSPLAWYDARDLRIEGKGWQDTPSFFSRLPTRAKDYATSTVWTLSGNTAGICVRFGTDSTTIGATWDGNKDGAMNHMAASGSAGLD